jgi:hypothetical protein
MGLFSTMREADRLSVAEMTSGGDMAKVLGEERESRNARFPAAVGR